MMISLISNGIGVVVNLYSKTISTENLSKTWSKFGYFFLSMSGITVPNMPPMSTFRDIWRQVESK